VESERASSQYRFGVLCEGWQDPESRQRVGVPVARGAQKILRLVFQLIEIRAFR
jgi:hypothetical protein